MAALEFVEFSVAVRICLATLTKNQKAVFLLRRFFGRIENKHRSYNTITMNTTPASVRVVFYLEQQYNYFRRYNN